MISPKRLLFVCACALLLATGSAGPAQAASGATPTVKAHYYAVTLSSGFTPVDDKAAVRAFRDRRVYQTALKVFGKDVYFLRVGFFKSFAEAEAFKTRIADRYPGAWSTAISDAERARYSNAAAPGVAPARETGTQRAEEFYAINLASSTDQYLELPAAIPPAFKSLRLYTARYTQDGKILHLLNLGFFETQEDARRALAALTPDFPGAGVLAVSRAERDAAAKNLWVAKRRPPPAPPAKVGKPGALPATPDVEARAAELMTQGSQALTRGDNQAAIVAFNGLLMLPPNSRSRDAQEYVGLARERSGQLDKARIEYELYLKLYPDGEGADRVRQRLANLSATRAVARELKAPKREEASEASVYGSVSQHYYRGASQVDTTTLATPTVPQPTLSSVDQSSLVSNLDFNARWRSSGYDNKFVIRDTHVWNFLDDQDNDNRLSAAYFEHKNRGYDYSMRIGRQSGTGGGVLGRFDGISGGWNFLPQWRINLVAGQLADTKLDTDQVFYGTSVDLGTFAGSWNGALYYIVQQADDIIDREAVGAELRYFDPRRTVFSLVDYDVSYGELNIAMLQGSRQTAGGTSFNLLADYRKAPPLQTTNAVIGETTSSVTNLLTLICEESLRALARDRTAASSLLSIGVTHPVTRIWQLGADLSVTRTSGLPSTTTTGGTVLSETTGGGKVKALTLQAIGTGLITDRDISVVSLGYRTGETFEAESATLTNRSLFANNTWTVAASLGWYRMDSDNGSTLNRTTPSVVLSYRAGEHITLEIEAKVELEKLRGIAQEDESRRSFYSLGYRWDF
ncbi:MAG TPA: tetratricopeptide repeat protein [Acidiferrobacterales bacterium]